MPKKPISKSIEKPLPKKKTWSKTIEFFSALGFMALIYSFFPKTNILATNSINPYDPFMQQFEIENNSLIPMKDVSYYYNIPKIILSNKTVFDNSIFLTPKRIPNIPHGKRSTISIEQSIHLDNPIGYDSINLYIVVHYKYFYFSCSESTNFIARRTFDNKYVWSIQ